MALFSAVVEAFVASREWDTATLTRIAFWNTELGTMELSAITIEHIDASLVRLAERGRLKGGKHATITAQAPLSGATVNRYISQCGGIFKYARKLRLVPRSFVPPTRGIEKTPEHPDPDRYLRPEEVDRILAVTRVVDRRWGKMAALITVCFHTGLRVGNVLRMRGRDLDITGETITVMRTKNGDPHVAALSTAALLELKRLAKQQPDALVFGAKNGKPFVYRKLWERITRAAGLPGRQFHQLRHGFGFQLARAGVSQTMLMQSMGHKTLSASSRYAHASVGDKRAIITKVFG